MQDENGNQVKVGNSIGMTCTIEKEFKPEIDKDIVLSSGTYQIEVPEGQSATIRYSLSLT